MAALDPGWDLLSISGTLAITATSGSKFNVNLSSLTANAAGTVSDFNAGLNYTFVFVTTTGGISGFDASVFNLDPSSFANPYTGTCPSRRSGTISR